MATNQDTREIPLTRGMVAVVDAVDFEALAPYRWQAVPRPNMAYALRVCINGTTRSTMFMHREIMGLRFGDSRVVDHINRDGLDNRRINLRLATCSQNSQNRYPHGTCGLLGVTWHQKRFRAVIKVNGKNLFLGSFTAKEAAARTYDDAAVLFYGPLASTNARLGLLHGS